MTLLTLAKHLAGRHDQSKHGRRRNFVKNPSNLSSYFNAVRINSGLSANSDLRMPVFYTKDGDFIFPGSMNKMISHQDIAAEVYPYTNPFAISNRNAMIDTQTRFWLEVDGNNTVSAIQLVQYS